MKSARILKAILLSAVSGLLVYTVIAPRAIADETKNAQPTVDEKPEQEKEYKPKTKAQLRRILTPIQYEVTQNAGTEQAFRNAYWNNKREGIYRCRCCDLPLFSSDTKFKSGTGWPSFWDPLNKDAVGLSKDWKLFYVRVEVHCKRCGAHLGHVFDDGPKPTGKRYCMNSAAMKFARKDDKEKKTPIKSADTSSARSDGADSK